MNRGKIASQAGHAYLDAFLNVMGLRPDICLDYLDNPTKICLGANQGEFAKLDHYLQDNKIRYVRVEDPDFTIQGDKVVPNNGDYMPAFTAIGIFMSEEEKPSILKRLKLLV